MGSVPKKLPSMLRKDVILRDKPFHQRLRTLSIKIHSKDKDVEIPELLEHVTARYPDGRNALPLFNNLWGQIRTVTRIEKGWVYGRANFWGYKDCSFPFAVRQNLTPLKKASTKDSNGIEGHPIKILLGKRQKLYEGNFFPIRLVGKADLEEGTKYTHQGRVGIGSNRLSVPLSRAQVDVIFPMGIPTGKLDISTISYPISKIEFSEGKLNGKLEWKGKRIKFIIPKKGCKPIYAKLKPILKGKSDPNEILIYASTLSLDQANPHSQLPFASPEVEKWKFTVPVKSSIEFGWDQLSFHQGKVSAQATLVDISQQINLEVQNPYLEPDFEKLTPFFSTQIGEKIRIHVEGSYSLTHLKKHSIIATSPQIDLITPNLVKDVREGLLIREQTREAVQAVLRWEYREKQPGVHGFDTFFDSQQVDGTDFHILIEELISPAYCTHRQEIHYLSQLHQNARFALRFSTNPFCLLFLIKYQPHRRSRPSFHFVLEAHEQDFATYIWHLPSLDEMKDTFEHIAALLELTEPWRERYSYKAQANFDRVFHKEYEFELWKEKFEETLNIWRESIWKPS